MLRIVILSCCIFLTSLTTKAQSHDSLLLATSIQKLKNAKAYTLEVADLMPAEKYGYKPAEEEMSFSAQLIHIAHNLGWLSSAYITETGKNPVSDADRKLQSKDNVRAVVSRSYDYAIATLISFDTRHLSDTVKFFAGPMTKLQILTLINDHQTHHRGQLMVYLRLNGIKPPKYVGW